MQTQEATIVSKGCLFRPYSLSQNCNRIFYGNAIQFINSGTGNIFINDVFLLVPGASLSLDGSPGDIDFTPYKIQFTPGAATNLLQIWIKEDLGSSAIISKMLHAPIGKIIDRRIQNRNYANRQRKNSNF